MAHLRIRTIFLLSFIQACGGSELTTALDAGSSGTAEDADAAPSSWSGPIDASHAPATLTLRCAGSTMDVVLRLPCAVGQDPINATECYEAGDLSPHPQPFLNLVLPLHSLPLNQPIKLDEVVSGPGGHAIRGTITYLQIDAKARAFVARIQSDPADLGTGGCTVDDAILWGVAGAFL